jgi:hypothetical protein
MARCDKDAWEAEEIVESPARLLIRLTKMMVPTLEQYGHLEELVKLASWAYIAGAALKNWADATRMAYQTANTYGGPICLDKKRAKLR